MANVPCGFWVQPISSRYGSATLAASVSFPNFSDIGFGEAGLRIVATRLFRHFCQTNRNGVPRILGSIAPLKVAGVVIRRIAVFMVDVRPIVRIWNVRKRNGAMDKQAGSFAGNMQIDALMCSAPSGIELRQPHPTVRSRSAIPPDHSALRVRPNTAIFGNCVKPLKARNIFHLMLRFASARGHVTT